MNETIDPSEWFTEIILIFMARDPKFFTSLESRRWWDFYLKNGILVCQVISLLIYFWEEWKLTIVVGELFLHSQYTMSSLNDIWISKRSNHGFGKGKDLVKPWIWRRKRFSQWKNEPINKSAIIAPTFFGRFWNILRVKVVIQRMTNININGKDFYYRKEKAKFGGEKK